LWLFSGLSKAIECHALVRQMKRTHKTVTLMMETHRGARGGFSSSSLVCLGRWTVSIEAAPFWDGNSHFQFGNGRSAIL
jgi:hypothetical protein